MSTPITLDRVLATMVRAQALQTVNGSFIAKELNESNSTLITALSKSEYVEPGRGKGRSKYLGGYPTEAEAQIVLDIYNVPKATANIATEIITEMRADIQQLKNQMAGLLQELGS